MSPSPSSSSSSSETRTLDRLGGVVGLLAVGLLVVAFSTGEMPPPNHPIGSIAADIETNQAGILFAAYVGALMVVGLLVFGGCVVARLRRSEQSAGWSVLALIGVAGTSTWLLADAAAVEVVRAVHHGATGDALWVGYGLDHWIGTVALLPWALFMIVAGVGSLRTSSLPRWTSVLGIAAGAFFLVGFGSITGDELSGGPLGIPWFVGILLTVVWVVAVSVSLLRPGRGRARTPAGIATRAGS